MGLLLTCLMPPTMLGLIFFLARIEERHLTARPRVGDADPEGPARA